MPNTTNDRPLMACGCRATGVRITPDGTELPACIACGVSDVMPTAPDLTGRRMRCAYAHDGKGCPRTRHGGGCCQPGTGHTDTDGARPSDANTPFFRYRPGSDFDEFYCGCWGWD